MSQEAAIARIEKQLKELAKPKPFWVSAQVIKEMTGWDKAELKRQRKRNPQIYKTESSRSFVYNISMIPDALIKKQ